MSRKTAIRENIPALIIRGEHEFYTAFGIKDAKKQAQMRSLGMPHYFDGKVFFYFPEEVTNWMKKNYKVILPFDN